MPAGSEAAIASIHAYAFRIEDTDWVTIISLYDALMTIRPSPIVALNRAIAVAQRDGPDRGLEEIAAIEDRSRLATYTFYAAALGDPFAANPDRGVFRSKDGGKTWQKALHLSDTLGAADLEIQPGNPKVLFACMWHGQRKPWTIISGALEGGIYKSTDGGDTWNKLGNGLPHELFGRSNVAISNSKPDRIYALIEAKPGSGLYRSEDAGAT